MCSFECHVDLSCGYSWVKMIDSPFLMPEDLLDLVTVSVDTRIPDWSNFHGDVIISKSQPLLDGSVTDVRHPTLTSFRTVEPRTEANPEPEKRWVWMMRPINRGYVGSLKEMGSNGALAEGNAWDDYTVPGTARDGKPGVKPVDEEIPLPDWRLREYRWDRDKAKRMRTGLTAMTSKVVCHENHAEVNAIIKALEDNVNALRMANADLPNVLCLTKDQMATLKDDNPEVFDMLSDAFEEVKESDVPVDGTAVLGMEMGVKK